MKSASKNGGSSGPSGSSGSGFDPGHHWFINHVYLPSVSSTEYVELGYLTSEQQAQLPGGECPAGWQLAHAPLAGSANAQLLQQYGGPYAMKTVEGTLLPNGDVSTSAPAIGTLCSCETSGRPCDLTLPNWSTGTGQVSMGGLSKSG